MTSSACPSCGAIVAGSHCHQCGAKLSPTPSREEVSLGIEGLVIEQASPTATSAIGHDARRKSAAYLQLQPSETAVLHAASRIFAAMIAKGDIDETNEKQLADRSVYLATRMAIVIERYVQSDSEDW